MDQPSLPVHQIPERVKGKQTAKHVMPRKPYAAFQQLCRTLNISPKRACELLGYAPSTWHGWQADGVPFVAHLALYNMVAINDARKPQAPHEPPPAPLVAVYCVRPNTQTEDIALRGFLDLTKLAYVVA